jgi:hypothetical protein
MKQNPKPQVDQKHPPESQHELSPDRLAGQNIGVATEEAEREAPTAYDIKDVHRSLHDLSDDDLKQVPVLCGGMRLRQGATYIDLRGDRTPFTVTGDMAVEPNQSIVPKDRVPYEIWNRIQRPEEETRESTATPPHGDPLRKRMR